MYLRLAFWTLAMAYTSVLLSRGTSGPSPSTMITAALFGAILGLASVACSSIDVLARKVQRCVLIATDSMPYRCGQASGRKCN